MRALHVVRVDFELRVCFDLGIFGKEEVVVFLVCLRLLGNRFDYDSAMELGLGGSRHYAPEHLTR